MRYFARLHAHTLTHKAPTVLACCPTAHRLSHRLQNKARADNAAQVSAEFQRVSTHGTVAGPSGPAPTRYTKDDKKRTSAPVTARLRAKEEAELRGEELDGEPDERSTRLAATAEEAQAKADKHKRKGAAYGWEGVYAL